MAEGQTITLRLEIRDPVPGVAYSLQTKTGAPVKAVVAGGGPIAFDVPVRLAPGPRFLGDFVRSEGPTRRFVYIAIGGQAGQSPSPCSGRAKVDIQDVPDDLLAEALAGKVLAVTLPGRGKGGGPALATLKPIDGWRIAD
jgi:hypothetical protein